jgi:hypothetical protein
MRYAVTFVFESRYGERPGSPDAEGMLERIGDWAGLLTHENNNEDAHLGLHARIVSVGFDSERPASQPEITGMVRRSAAWAHAGPLRLTLGES